MDIPVDYLRNILREILNNIDTPVDTCLDSFHDHLEKLSSPVKLNLKTQSIMYVKTIMETFGDMEDTAEKMNRYIELQILLLLEFRRFTHYSTELAADPSFSELLGQLLRKLGVCLTDRSKWKKFLDDEVTGRYGQNFGRTLYEVYMILGLEPPDCLPNDEFNLTSTTSILSDQLDETTDDENAKITPLIRSPRATRSAARQSLPRALFTDPAIVAVAANLTSSTPQPSTCINSTPSLSLPCSARSVMIGSHSICSTVPSPASATITNAPKLVLITNQRSRRKCRTPTKRTPVAHSNRKSRTGSTTSASKDDSSKSNRNGKSSKPAIQSNSTKRSTSRRSKSNADNKHLTRGTIDQVNNNTSGIATPKRRYHRSVHETPNPERSYPRWERARMAAAEKTRNKEIVVEESPIKPLVSLGSPLRRLRRANSMLTNLYYIESQEALIRTGSNRRSTDALSKSSSLPQDGDSRQSSHLTPQNSLSRLDGCVSIAMSRAEQWRRRQYEEEASLSQYATQMTSSSMGSPPMASEFPCQLVQHTPSSGLLCVPGGLHRHNSNLFANMVSPERVFCDSPKKDRISLSSPPPIKIAGRVVPLLSPSRMELSRSPEHIVKTPRTTPQRRKRAAGTTAGNRSRKRHPSASAVLSSCRNEILVSPQVFDEEAMFLGRDEFLNETNTTCSSLNGGASPGWSRDTTAEPLSGRGFVDSLRSRATLASPVFCYNDPPPIMRLDSLPKIVESDQSPDHSKSSDGLPRKRRLPQDDTIITPTKDQIPTYFPYLAKPERSPFAPVHVFNPRQTVKTFTSCDLVDSSQSASAVFAMRSRLFGNSDSNGTNPSVTDKENSQTPISPRGCSRHASDDSLSQHALSPGLRRLHRAAAAAQCSSHESTPNKPSAKKLLLPSMALSTATSVANLQQHCLRPRRSLFR